MPNYVFHKTFTHETTFFSCLNRISSIWFQPKAQGNNKTYFFICARPELFCDFLQFDWLHERAAFYDILARGARAKRVIFLKTNQGVELIIELE